ncbi:hypothetical protein EU245_11990 [Lentibacillus lipolyticus]|nr:hypothetical protein EU245_11990 [Lentibacillus lipolyticus]
MSNNQFILYNRRKKPIVFEPSRVALYRQCEVVEAVSENNDMYYLFFYNYRFLTAAKATKLKRRSFIASALQHGMVFEAPHPFIECLFSSNQALQMKGFDTLIKELDKRYSLLEKAFILTFFESFISKKRLFEAIKAIFYIYRRSGQNFNGYQIIRILMDFAPGHSFVRQMAADKSFRQYKDQYDQHDEAVLSADPVFFEKVAYANSDDNTYLQQLITHLEQSSRWIDVLALYSIHFVKNPATHTYDSLISIAASHLTAHQVTQLQEKLYQHSPHFAPLERALLTSYAKGNQVVHVLTMLDGLASELHDEQYTAIREMFFRLDLQQHTLPPALLPALIRSVTLFDQKQADELLHTFISALLVEYEPGYMKTVLQPFMDNQSIHPVYLKLDRMDRFSNDLEQMQALGELYDEFNQPSKAIECFSWEMELKPDDPAPLKGLSKIYRQLGHEQEAKAYRTLLQTIQKQAR